jgi:hypothetical protein
MSSRKTFIRLFSFLLIISVSFAQQRQQNETDLDKLIKGSPSMKGNLFYPLPSFCPLFSLEGSTSGEPMDLLVYGEDFSAQGGSKKRLWNI